MRKVQVAQFPDGMKLLDVKEGSGYQDPCCAALAQLVERSIRNAEVVSSSLTCGTTFFRWLAFQ